jgi:hypothetical protein
VDFNNDAIVGRISKTFGWRVRAVRGASSCLPATGQTTCWNSSGTVIPCTGTGQDGELQEGAPLSYADNGDGTVSDSNTGLMWEKQSDDGSVHDRDTFYTWDQAFSSHVATLNTMAFAGYTDWRVPNVRELHSIVNYENALPSVSAAFNTSCTPGCTVLTCSCTAGNERYWSSSSGASGPVNGWENQEGFVGLLGKAAASKVRAVRGGL